MDCTVDERGDGGKLGWARMGSDGWFEVPGASDVLDVIDGLSVVGWNFEPGLLVGMKGARERGTNSTPRIWVS